MPHEIERLLRAAGQGVWLIEPQKAEAIVSAIALRARMGPRAEPAFDERPKAEISGEVSAGQKTIRVLRLMGTILPRGNMMADISGPGAANLVAFQRAFRQAAEDSGTSAIVIEIDSPGGQIDLVPETAAMIRAARRADRPIVAVANTLAASAAYWIASAADELVVTPSGTVGSIGVYMLHRDVSAALQAQGIAPTFIFEGARKVEGNPFEPLDDAARKALQADVRSAYEAFTKDVAKARGVPVSVVRADPETSERHMGGGRAYGAQEAVRLGMADRVATLDETIQRLARGGKTGRGRRNASLARQRMNLL